GARAESLHLCWCRQLVIRPIAKLAGRAVAPLPYGSVRLAGDRERRASSDGRHATACTESPHEFRGVMVRRRLPVTELPRRAVTPGEAAAVRLERHAEAVARGDGPDIVQAADFCGSRPVVLRAVAELARSVVSPGVDPSLRRHGEAVVAARSNRHDRS